MIEAFALTYLLAWLAEHGAAFPRLTKRLRADEAWSSSGQRLPKVPYTELMDAQRIAHNSKRFLYFASGSSRPPHIRGMAQIGMPIGVAASEISRDSVEELKKIGGPPAHLDIFVDSGAFEEFTHPQKIANLQSRMAKLQHKAAEAGLTAAEAKTLANAPKRLERFLTMENEPDWEGTGRRGRPLRPVLPLYAELARTLGDWVHVVAPDKIADQEATLERMTRYGPTLVDIARDGAEVFVPLQFGNVALDVFEEKALTAMGVPDELLYKFVPAMPLKAAALPFDEVLQYVEKWKPRRLHLLGVGPKRRAEQGRPSGLEMVAQILALSPYTELSLDSALIPASTGKTSGPGKGPRILTGAREVVKAQGYNPTEVQEYAMVVAWPELYLNAMLELGERARWVVPRLPSNLPVGAYRQIWITQLHNAGMHDAAADTIARWNAQEARLQIYEQRQRVLEARMPDIPRQVGDLEVDSLHALQGDLKHEDAFGWLFG